jgi:hypothetical protein
MTSSARVGDVKARRGRSPNCSPDYRWHTFVPVGLVLPSPADAQRHSFGAASADNLQRKGQSGHCESIRQRPVHDLDERVQLRIEFRYPVEARGDKVDRRDAAGLELVGQPGVC